MELLSNWIHRMLHKSLRPKYFNSIDSTDTLSKVRFKEVEGRQLENRPDRKEGEKKGHN